MLSKSCGVVVNGNHTDIVVNVHSNRIFIVISQYEKLGSIVTVCRDAAVQGFNNTTVYDTKVIFGKDEPEILSATRHFKL
uniref:Uncharacterized protein n=1 Tax=Trichogramma kaykai TaxID=54128 RepID=A0ABD2WMX3_9HYME